jgi:hypothetical protein
LDPGLHLAFPCTSSSTGSDCPVPEILIAGCVNQNGQIATALACAKSIAAILGDGASVPAGSGGQGSVDRQPLGELISVDVELTGLQGQSIFLSWSIFPENASGSLPAKWSDNFVAYRLVPTTNDDTGSLEMWIPLPEQQGPYFVRLTLTTGDASLASMDSGPFD